MNQGANLHFPAAVGRESASLQSDSRKPRFTNPKSEQTYNTWHRPLQGHKNGTMEGLGTTNKRRRERQSSSRVGFLKLGWVKSLIFLMDFGFSEPTFTNQMEGI